MVYGNTDIIAKAERFVSTTRGDAIDLAFSIVDNVGMYSRGADILSLGVGGNTPLDLTTTSIKASVPIEVVNGSQLVPTYAFTSSSDTGMYLDSTGTIGYTSNGSKVMTVDELLTRVYSTNCTLPATQISDLTITGNLQLPLKAPGSDRLAPSYSFVGDTDTGFYREGDGKVAISCNGTKVVQFSPTQVDFLVGTALSGLFNDGLVTAPSISFTNDSNTGFFRKGGGTVGYSSDGTESVTLDSDGIKLKDGSFGYPSVSFASNPSIGLYKTGTYLGISEYGSKVAEFSHTDIKPYAPLRSLNGTVSAPVYSFQNSPTTGLYSPATDQLALSIAGSQTVAMTSSLLESKTRVKIPTSTVAGPAVYSIDSLGWLSGLYTLDSANGQIGFSISGNPTFYSDTSKNVSANKIQNINGIVSAPAYSFSSTPDTGMYFSGSSLCLAQGGTKMLEIVSPVVSTPGIFRGSDTGFRYAPTYAFNAGSDSGMFLAPGYLGFSIGSNEGMKLSNADGIAGNRFSFINDTDTFIGNTASNEMGLYCGGSLRASFNYNGANKLYGSVYTGDRAEAYPSYSFVNDITSGLHLWTAGEVCLAAGGFDCATFKNKKIHAYKNTSTNVATYTWNNDPTTGFNSWLSGGINMITGGTERVQIGTSYIIPAYDAGISCGLSGYSWGQVSSYAFLNASDQRLKDNIQDCTLGLDFIKSIRPVEYNWKNRIRKHRGFIAQEVKSVCDDFKICGSNNNDIGFWSCNSINSPDTTPLENTGDSQSLNYIEFIPILVKAIHELEARVAALEG